MDTTIISSDDNGILVSCVILRSNATTVTICNTKNEGVWFFKKDIKVFDNRTKLWIPRWLAKQAGFINDEIIKEN